MSTTQTTPTGTATLSGLLSKIETAAAKVRSLEADLTAERTNLQTLAEQYRAQSGEALKALGIAVPVAKERKARTSDQIIMSAVARSVRTSTKAGEKNVKAILAAALDFAAKAANKKCGLAELPADVRAKIEERVKTLTAKSRPLYIRLSPDAPRKRGVLLLERLYNGQQCTDRSIAQPR